MRKRHVNSCKDRKPLEWMIVDCFAGGGGASTGIEMALGRSPDVAVNHSGAALAIHSANHPWTRHYKTDVREIDPLVVTRNKPVGLAWFSPDCTFFSKSRGGKPIRVHGKKVRGLAWVVVNWARKARPRVIILENVEEFQGWGPVIHKVGTDGFPVFDETGNPWYVPCPKRRGQTFRKWVRRLEALGGRVEWRELRGCDYGAPTIRKRLFVIIRFDNEPIVWPEPTHGKPDSPEVIAGKRLPWRTAADDVIDWTLPCPSIFLTRKEGRRAGVNRPLKENTMRRIAKGLERYVLRCKRPFIVSCNHKGDWFRGQGVDEPYPTATCSREGLGIVEPTMTPFCVPNYGERYGQEPRCRTVEQPLATVTCSDTGSRLVMPVLDSQYGNSAGVSVQSPCPTVTAGGGGKTAIVAPIIDTYHGARPDGTLYRSMELHEPLRTQDTSNRHALVEAFIAQHNLGNVGHHPSKPLSTLTTSGSQQQVVQAAFMAQHNTGSIGHGAAEPLSTLVHRGTQQQLVAASLITNTTGHGPASAESPVPTITTGLQQGIAAAFLSHQYGSNTAGGNGDPTEPAKTVTAGGKHHAAVKAFLRKYYGNSNPRPDCADVARTASAKEDLGVVTVNGVEYVIVDIGMRMLTARELFRAQGFPNSYQIDVWCDDRRNDKGKPLKPGMLTKEEQVKAAGNSVCPQVAEALVSANCPWLKVSAAAERKRRRQLELPGVWPGGVDVAWLYSDALVRFVNSPCSQEREAGFSVDVCSDGEPSAPSRSIPTAPAYLWHDKTTVAWSRFPSGMTPQRLTDVDGAAVLTSYLRAFPVKTSPSPAKATDWMGSGPDCGDMRRESLAKYDPESCTWKTHQRSLFGDWIELSGTWPRCGMTRDGELFLRSMPELPTRESGSGSMPTPLSTDSKNETLPQEALVRRSAHTRGVRLSEYLLRMKYIPTPMAGGSHSGGRFDELGGSHNTLRGTEYGRLLQNPTWTEEVMRWPIGWTDLAPLATDKFQSWRQSHGVCFQREDEHRQ